jgi:predicted deacylase
MTAVEPHIGPFGGMPFNAWNALPQTLPRFPVRVALPDLRRWQPGNTGIPGVWRFAAGAPGPHLVITCLIHGNEIAGALALDTLLRAGPNPARGTLTLVFANLEAAARFDPENPTASRFADEDMNRLWDASLLAGHRTSHELTRARALQPVIDAADVLLDLHSMLWPSDPLILCGPSEKGRALARAVGVPPLVVADHGHLGGRRLIDYAPFVDPADPRTAILVEAGPHWEPDTVRSMSATIEAALGATGLGPLPTSKASTRVAEVTLAITANSGAFAFTSAYRGGEVIKHRNTLIAIDGGIEIRTPYDDCVLIMPSPRPGRGHTAVRLAKYV